MDLSKENLIRQLQLENSQLKEKVDRFSKEIAELKKKHESRKKQAFWYIDEVGKLQAQLAEKDKEIEALEEELVILEKENCSPEDFKCGGCGRCEACLQDKKDNPQHWRKL